MRGLQMFGSLMVATTMLAAEPTQQELNAKIVEPTAR